MDIAAVDGAPVCNALRILRHQSRPSLTGHEVRRIPISEWVAFACSMVAVGNQGARSSDAEWRSEGYREDMERIVKRSTRRRLDDDFLRDVARVYRANANLAPTAAVRETFGPIEYPTASRWVKLARERGFLPPTTPGKVTVD